MTGLGIGMVCLIGFVLSNDDRGIIRPTKEKGTCTQTIWKRKSISFYHNETGILKKGDGRKQIATYERKISGIFNVTENVTICCPGFHKNDKGTCEQCPDFTYGLNCSNKCRCLSSENCNHTTGECKRCNENPAGTRCDEETSSGTPETRAESSSIFTIVSHTTLFHRQKITTKSSTNTKQIDVSVFPTAEESKQDPKEALQRGDVSTPIVAISVVISVLVMIIVLALLVKRYHGRYNVKKRGTTESVHKLMSESSHTMNESHELTQVNTSDEILRGDSFGYKDVDGNRVYVSMYNAMNVAVRHEDSDIEGKSKDLQYISMHLQYLTESMPQSVQNDHETVESK